MEKEFVIRSYGYCELAMLYFPNSTKKSASAQLSRWIKCNSELKKQLSDNGFVSGMRILTPLQVKIIIKLIGEP
jgi:hypothetical protein